jgi:hypothetical protein
VLPSEIGFGADTHQCSPEPHFGRADASLTHAEIRAATDAVASAKLIDAKGRSGGDAGEIGRSAALETAHGNLPSRLCAEERSNET